MQLRALSALLLLAAPAYAQDIQSGQWSILIDDTGTPGTQAAPAGGIMPIGGGRPSTYNAHNALVYFDAKTSYKSDGVTPLWDVWSYSPATQLYVNYTGPLRPSLIPTDCSAGNPSTYDGIDFFFLVQHADACVTSSPFYTQNPGSFGKYDLAYMSTAGSSTYQVVVVNGTYANGLGICTGGTAASCNGGTGDVNFSTDGTALLVTSLLHGPNNMTAGNLYSDWGLFAYSVNYANSPPIALIASAPYQFSISGAGASLGCERFIKGSEMWPDGAGHYWVMTAADRVDYSGVTQDPSEYPSAGNTNPSGCGALGMTQNTNGLFKFNTSATGTTAWTQVYPLPSTPLVTPAGFVWGYAEFIKRHVGRNGHIVFSFDAGSFAPASVANEAIKPNYIEEWGWIDFGQSNQVQLSNWNTYGSGLSTLLGVGVNSYTACSRQTWNNVDFVAYCDNRTGAGGLGAGQDNLLQFSWNYSNYLLRPATTIGGHNAAPRGAQIAIH